MALYKISGKNSQHIKLIVLVVLLSVALLAMLKLNSFISGYTEKPLDSSVKLEYADQIAEKKGAFTSLRMEPEVYHQAVDRIKELEKSHKTQKIEKLENAVQKVYAWFAFKDDKWLHDNLYSRSLWHHERIMRSPSTWRFHPLHVYGMLVGKVIVDLPDNPPGLQKLFLLKLYDIHDRVFFTVLTPSLPQDAIIFKAATDTEYGHEGSTLAFDGVYIMNFPYSTPKGLRHTPLFAAKEVHFAKEARTPVPRLDEASDPGVEYKDIKPKKSVPGLDLDYLRGKIYSPPKGGDKQLRSLAVGVRGAGADRQRYLKMAADLRGEKSALVHVFEYLFSLDDQAIDRFSASKDINYSSIMSGDNFPGWMLGKFTRFRGIAFSVEILKFPDASDGIERIYLVTVGDSNYTDVGDKTWVIATPNLPKNFRRGDRVEAEGIFLKLYPYRSTQDTWHWSPLLLTKNIRIVQLPGNPLIPTWIPLAYLPWIVGVVILLISFVLFMMYRSSIHDTNSLERIKQRSQRRAREAIAGKKKSGGNSDNES